MKIVFVLDCAHNLTNGTTATCNRFASELRKRGHQVTVVGCDFMDGKEHPDYVPLARYHFPFFQWLIEREGFCFAHADYAKLYNVIKDADLVHVFLPFKLENSARLIAQGLGVPVTSAYHLQPQNITGALHLGWTHGLNDMLYFAFRKYLFDYTHLVHCPSKMIADQLPKHHYRHNKTFPISNGVTDFFHPIAADKPSEIQDKYVITMSGRLAGEKRQDLIIKAVKESKYEKKIQIIFCGTGPDHDKLVRLAKRKHLTNMPLMKFCSQEELRKILNYTDLYVHASDFETEGISCIEAFACGTVPVISDAPQSATNRFSIDDRCLFRHGNYHDLAKKIDYFIEHPEEKSKLSERYLEEARNYQLPLMVSKMEKMLLEAVEEKKEGIDLPTAHPRKKDIRKEKKIFRRLLKQGVIKEMPERLR